MSEERDFDYVVGKLPRKDKDGNDTTGDCIGKGAGIVVTEPIPLLLMIWKWSMKTLPRLSLRSRRSLSAEKLLK